MNSKISCSNRQLLLFLRIFYKYQEFAQNMQ